MENNQEKVIHDRLNGLEKRVGSVDKKVDTLDDKIDMVDDKHSDRHLEMVKLTTELQGSSKATEQNTNRMANSIEGLVDELKTSNSRTDDRFKMINEEVQVVKSKIEGREEDRKIKLEEKRMSNGVLIAFISGGFILVQVCVNVIAPLFFG